MTVYINKGEQYEPAHVHVCRGSRQRKGDLKYWLDERDFEPSTKKGYTASELSKLRGYFALYHDECYAEWNRINGDAEEKKL